MVMTIQVPHKLILATAALVALTGAASADWRNQITDFDAGRLTSLEQARSEAAPNPADEDWCAYSEPDLARWSPAAAAASDGATP